jgi:translation initiation factor 1 (eIF-1/SUI1)
MIHIRVQRKSKSKCLTLIEGLDKLDSFSNKTDVQLNNATKIFKKLFNCGVTLVKPENTIQLMGDHGEAISEYLIKYNIATSDQIILHRY